MSDFDPSNDHAHKVTLDDYYLARYETTIGDFDLFRELQGKQPYAQNLRNREDRQHLFHPDKPAWTRDWQEPKDYCEWVGELAGQSTDLPTEAQWEFAARNRGKKVRYATSNGMIEQGVNYPTVEERQHQQVVGQYPANPLGIYDLSANASELVRDWYDADYYSESPTLNPQGPATGKQKVLRAGSNAHAPESNTTVVRAPNPAPKDYYRSSIGFRCANYELPSPQG